MLFAPPTAPPQRGIPPSVANDVRHANAQQSSIDGQHPNAALFSRIVEDAVAPLQRAIAELESRFTSLQESDGSRRLHEPDTSGSQEYWTRKRPIRISIHTTTSRNKRKAPASRGSHGHRNQHPAARRRTRKSRIQLPYPDHV